MFKIYKNILYTFVFISSLLLLVMSVRGARGNPNENSLNNKEWSNSGPFELSPERARFALTYSIVENHSFQLNEKLALFSIPDLGYLNGKFVSLFQPGVSILIIPGYIIGKYFGYSQLGSYFQISLFAFLNFVLVYLISRKTANSRNLSLLAGLIFLFASPSYAYAVSLFQHHISTFILLMSILLIISSKHIVSHVLFWMFYGISIIVDFPNAFVFLPLVMFVLRDIVSVERNNKNLKINLNTKYLLSFFVIIAVAFMFFTLNYLSYGNPFRLSGTVTQIKQLDQFGNPKLPEVVIEKDASGFFDLSYLPVGLYAHLISVDRGVLIFAPVMLFGILGLLQIRKQNIKLAYLLSSVILINIILYASFGIGGWGFGSRYLIPSYALLSIVIVFFLKNNKSKILYIVFYLSLVYSIFVNTAGAISSNKNPPKREAIGLQLISGRTELYSFDRNIQFIFEGNSKSFVFQNYASSKMSSWQYYLSIVSVIILLTLILSTIEIVERRKRN